VEHPDRQLDGIPGWLDPSVAVELLGERTDVISACVFAPKGRLTPEGAGRFRLDGRWSFSSGCRHADCLSRWRWSPTATGPGCSLDAARTGGWPSSGRDSTVIENWDVAGLRGTGSHDVTASAVLVPERHTMASFFEPARHDGPLWRFPSSPSPEPSLAGFPLGVARRALDEFAQLAPAKIRLPEHTSIVEEAMSRSRCPRGRRPPGSRPLSSTRSAPCGHRVCRGRAHPRPASPFPAGTQQAMWAAIEAWTSPTPSPAPPSWG